MVKKSLEHVQKLACLYITSAIRTTPTIALELIIGLVPLPVFVQEGGNEYLLPFIG